MTAAFFIAAVTIAFPREGAQFAYLERCYLIGATDGAETNLELRVVAPDLGAVHRQAGAGHGQSMRSSKVSGFLVG